MCTYSLVTLLANMSKKIQTAIPPPKRENHVLCPCLSCQVVHGPVGETAADLPPATQKVLAALQHNQAQLNTLSEQWQAARSKLKAEQSKLRVALAQARRWVVGVGGGEWFACGTVPARLCGGLSEESNMFYVGCPIANARSFLRHVLHMRQADRKPTYPAAVLLLWCTDCV
jgi:hypothetical protein